MGGLSGGGGGRHHKRTSPAAQDCLKLLRVVFPLLVAPLCLTSFAYTCLYAYIYATEGSYGKDDWQKCLTVPNIGNLHLDNNRFCTSASNFAGQAYLSLLVAVMGLHVGLRDNDLLPFSMYTSLVGLVGITVFRESYPYFDDPHFMSTTLVTLSKYIYPEMYDDLAANTHLPPELRDKIPDSQVCRTAYRVNLAFLAVQYGVLSLALLVAGMTLYAWRHRPRRGGPRVYIRGRELLLCFAGVAFVGMLTMLVSKELVADVAIRVARDDAHDTTYPFSDNNLDLVSFTTLLAIGVAVYAACKPSSAALTLCAGVAFINATRSVPGMLGTMAGYSGVYYPNIETSRDPDDGPEITVTEGYYVMWDIASCAQYVMTTNPGAFNLDADAEANAREMCIYFRSSIGGQLLTWAAILSLAVTAVFTLRRNPDVDKMVEAEREARWARQLGLQLPGTDTHNSGNSSGRAFPSSLYYSGSSTLPPPSGDGGGDLRHPLLMKDHLSSVQEGDESECDEEEENEDEGEVKDARV